MQFRNGDNASALETYRSAFTEMNRLCEEQPSLSALRIWRARGYSSAAQAATGAGEVDAAILLREQAAVELMELLAFIRQAEQPPREEAGHEARHVKLTHFVHCAVTS